tara:strand:- start:1887 stop:2111 length:225 start_codon:yes stop_codon:yes gene_type:complete
MKNTNFDLDNLNFHKMLFIYNAILNGWIVKKNKDNNFEFKKKKNNVKKEILLDNYLNIFVNENLNIDNIIANMS